MFRMRQEAVIRKREFLYSIRGFVSLTPFLSWILHCSDDIGDHDSYLFLQDMDVSVLFKPLQ